MSEWLVETTQYLKSSSWSLWGVIISGLLMSFIVTTRISVHAKNQKKLKKNLLFQLNFPLLEKNSKQTNKNFLGANNRFIQPIFSAIETLGGERWWNPGILILFTSCPFLLVALMKITHSWLLSSVLLVTFLGGFLILLFSRARIMRKKLVEQVPMFLSALGNALEAGYSLPNAFQFIKNEIPFPLKREVALIAHQLDLQIPLQTALLQFEKRIADPDLSFFVEGTIIQSKIGGNLIEMFQKISAVIGQRLKLQRDLKSFTSQGRISGIMIAALFPVSLLLFAWLSPSHVELLFGTSSGNALLAIAITLESIGLYLIWKIVNIKF